MAYQKVAKEVIPDQANMLCRVLSCGFFPHHIPKMLENARKIKVNVADIKSEPLLTQTFKRPARWEM